jgi:hypothetical protein
MVLRVAGVSPHNLRRASATRRRIACSAGNRPVTTPSTTHSPTPSSRSAVRKLKRGSSPPVGSPLTVSSQARASPSPPPSPASSAGFGEHQSQHLGGGETDGLEHAEFADALAHGLGHGAAGHEEDGEKHRSKNAGDNEGDVANLPRPGLGERALGLRLGLGRRVLKFLVDEPGDLRRLRGVLARGWCTTRPAPGRDPRRASRRNSRSGKTSAWCRSPCRALVDAHEVEFPRALAPDGRADRDRVADLPLKRSAVVRPTIAPVRVASQAVALLRRQHDLGEHRQEGSPAPPGSA